MHRSGVAYTLGDFVSQVYQGRTLKTVDLARSARSGAAGGAGGRGGGLPLFARIESENKPPRFNM